MAFFVVSDCQCCCICREQGLESSCIQAIYEVMLPFCWYFKFSYALSFVASVMCLWNWDLCSCQLYQCTITNLILKLSDMNGIINGNKSIILQLWWGRGRKWWIMQVLLMARLALFSWCSQCGCAELLHCVCLNYTNICYWFIHCPKLLVVSICNHRLCFFYFGK